MKGSIVKRGNKWSIVVDLGRDENGKRKQKWISGFEKKKEAEKKLPEILMEINNNQFVDFDNISFKAFLEKWLCEHAKPSVSPSTYSKYNTAAKKSFSKRRRYSSSENKSIPHTEVYNRYECRFISCQLFHLF